MDDESDCNGNCDCNCDDCRRGRGDCSDCHCSNKRRTKMETTMLRKLEMLREAGNQISFIIDEFARSQETHPEIQSQLIQSRENLIGGINRIQTIIDPEKEDELQMVTLRMFLSGKYEDVTIKQIREMAKMNIALK